MHVYIAPGLSKNGHFTSYSGQLAVYYDYSCNFTFFKLILGFIRINTAALGDSDTYVEVLDGSRIHPEAYDWAKKMAVDALEMDEDEGNPANALEEILQGPAKLHELNLEAFAQELERQGLGKKLVS